MPWTELGVSDVMTRLADAELSALRNVALAPDQPDPTAAVIAGVVRELRGRLRNSVAELQAGETVPDNWLHHCLAVVRHRLFSRLPLQSLLTPSRQREYEDAMAAFRQLGPILPDRATEPEPRSAPAPARPHIRRRRLEFTREAQAGL